MMHDDRMWLAGGGQPFFPDADFTNLGVWSSSDGKDWTRASHLPVILPRTHFGMESFAGELWVIGGNRYQNQAPPGALASWTDTGVAADVWSSPDGDQWTLRNAEGPFGARGINVTAVWKNRIWIFGGTGTAGTDLTDVWYAEAP